MKKAIVIMSVFVMSLGIAAVLYFNGVFSFDFTSPEAAADQPNPDTAVSQGQTVLPDQAIESDTQSEENRTDDGSTTTATSSTTTQTQQSTNEETTTKQTTTTTKSFFDIFTPKTTTTTRKATTTSKKTTTTTSNRTQTSTTNSTRSTTTTTTTKATTTTTKATQAQKTDYSISVNLPLSFNSSKTSQSIYNKWGNSDIEAQGALFGSNYVLLKDSYGGLSLKCSNSDFNNKITAVTSNSSIISITEIRNTFNYTGITLKANSAGKATITASIPNNTKTFSFTVAVVTEDQVIKKYQKEAMRLINEYRSNAGVDPLQADNGMKKTAETRAKECRQKFEDAMAAGQNEFTAEFAHTRPDGSTYAKAFPDKYLHGGWGVNENVGVGQPTPLRIAKSWYSSSGHRTTMLSTNYDRGYVGLSIADDGRFYWVLNVAGLSNATGYEVSEEDKAIEPVRD